MIIAGPGIKPKGFEPARAHVFDILPTVLELAGLPASSAPDESVPIRGRSLVPVLTGQADEVYGAKDAVGIEVATNAALYKGDWKLQKCRRHLATVNGVFIISTKTSLKATTSNITIRIFLPN